MTELKITIPEGMEIDTDNSVLTGDNPIIKFKSKNISYKDIMANCSEYVYDMGKNNRIFAADLKQAEKLIAIKQLMNIASYYNAKGGKKIDWENGSQNKYRIFFDKKEYRIDNNALYNFGSIYFLNREDAQSIIDNPNFREILDKICNNQ